MNEKDIYQEERPWGNFRQFTHNENSTVKIITVKPNESLSLQSHNKRTEFWRIISGSGIIEIDNLQKEGNVGDEFVVSVGAKHRMSAKENGMSVLEIATGDFDENDIVRYEDKYGRVKK